MGDCRSATVWLVGVQPDPSRPRTILATSESTVPLQCLRHLLDQPISDKYRCRRMSWCLWPRDSFCRRTLHVADTADAQPALLQISADDRTGRVRIWPSHVRLLQMHAVEMGRCEAGGGMAQVRCNR